MGSNFSLSCITLPYHSKHLYDLTYVPMYPGNTERFCCTYIQGLCYSVSDPRVLRPDTGTQTVLHVISTMNHLYIYTHNTHTHTHTVCRVEKYTVQQTVFYLSVGLEGKVKK